MCESRVKQGVGCEPRLCDPNSLRFVGIRLSVGSGISGRSGLQHLGKSLAGFLPNVLLCSLRPGNGPNL